MMQEFQRGDLVQVARYFGENKKNPPDDEEAIVIGSHADMFGTKEHSSYKLLFKGGREEAWFSNRDLTLIKSGQLDMLQQWKHEAELRRKVVGQFSADTNP
jgi:hypothetical protein